MPEWRYVCEVCGHSESIETDVWRCPVCRGAFSIEGPDRLKPGAIDTSAPGLWRYRRVLPVGLEYAHSLGEGMTPLVEGTLGSRPVWFKLDGLLPTGSFKDRGAVVFVAHLRRTGRKRVIVDSSGNAAAAMAGYCAAGGLACAVFAPATTSPGKLVQARAFGATVTLVEGSREDVAHAAQVAAAEDPTAFYASHNWHPIFVEGVKTWMMEVWEQLGQQLPSICFVPAGGGSALVGGWRGAAAVPGPQAPPALIAAQPTACAPIVAAAPDDETITPLTPGQTIAEGTRIGAPARSRQILTAIRQHSGGARAVSDEQIVAAIRELAAQGLYVEPTAAVGAAACRAAIDDGTMPDDGNIVVLLTGNGLKATDTISTILA